MSKKKKKDKKPFYTKVINAENYDNMETPNKRYFCYWRMVSFVGIAQGVGLAVTFTGFNFEHEFPIILYCVASVFLLLSFIILIKQYLVMKKYNIFKKNSYFWLLHLLNYILLTCVCISAYFNTHFFYEENRFGASINPVFYLFIFLPLMILYLLLLYYSYLKPFKKYAKKRTIENKTQEYLEKLEKTNLKIEEGIEESIAKDYIDEQSKEE